MQTKEAAPDQPMHVPNVVEGLGVARLGAEPDTIRLGAIDCNSSHRCRDRPACCRSKSRLACLDVCSHKSRPSRDRTLETAVANIILADDSVGVIRTSRLWTCVGFRCQTVTVDIGPRTWHRSHRYDGRTYVTFGGCNGRFKAYSLAPLLRKLQP